MTYDPKRNILFLHIPKNAGKSIEAMLGMVEPKELEHYRFRSLPSRAGTILQRLSADKQARQRLFGTIDYTLCAQHLTLQEIELLGLIPADQLRTATTLAVCRNPWSRAVSTYRHFRNASRQGIDKASFLEFCRLWYDTHTADHNVRAHQRLQVDFVRDTSGRIAIDVLLRFENLEEGAEKLASRGIQTRSLERIGAREHHGYDYHDFYTSESRDLIATRFQEDIDTFRYQF